MNLWSLTHEKIEELLKQKELKVKKHYDGYGQNGYEIYNPESVVMCMTTKKFGNFWSKTSTYAVIITKAQRRTL